VWRKRQTELNLNTVEQYEEVIRAFTCRANVIPKREPKEGDRQSENELVVVGEVLALLTKSSLTNAKLQRSFANFQALILLSYCAFLRKRGIPYETLDQIIQHITNAREFDRRILLACTRTSLAICIPSLTEEIVSLVGVDRKEKLPVGGFGVRCRPRLVGFGLLRRLLSGLRVVACVDSGSGELGASCGASEVSKTSEVGKASEVGRGVLFPSSIGSIGSRSSKSIFMGSSSGKSRSRESRSRGWYDSSG
jgi:hypothetical protein